MIRYQCMALLLRYGALHMFRIISDVLLSVRDGPHVPFKCSTTPGLSLSNYGSSHARGGSTWEHPYAEGESEECDNWICKCSRDKTERHAQYLWLPSPGRRLKLQEVLLHLFIHLHDGCHVSCSTVPAMRTVSHIMQSINAFHLFQPASG